MSNYGRLRSEAEFKAVRSARKVRRSTSMLVYQAPGPSETPRLGIVATVSLGTAVRRNRIKRRLRAAFGFEVAQAAAFRDFVIVAKPATASVSFAELRAEIARAISSAPGPTGDAPR